MYSGMKQIHNRDHWPHYNEVIMGAMASLITSLTIVYSRRSLFRRRSKKTSKLCVTGICAGNSPGTGEFPAQMASNVENVSIWWRHHAKYYKACCILQRIFMITSRHTIVNTLRPRQKYHHLADIFKCIFMNEMYEFCLRFHWILFLRF